MYKMMFARAFVDNYILPHGYDREEFLEFLVIALDEWDATYPQTE